MGQPKNINSAILGVLESIDEKLELQQQDTAKLNTNLEGMASTGVVSEGEYKDFAKFFGVLAKGLTTLVKAASKIDEKSAENIKTVLCKIGEGISAFFKDVEPGQIDEFNRFIGSLGWSIFKLAGFLALSLPLLLVAPISAALLGLTFLVLMKVLPEADAKKQESLNGIVALLDMASGILWFAIGMTLFLLVSPAVMLGAVMFGLTIRLLNMIIGDSAKNGKEQASGVAAILGVADGILWFSLGMLLFLLVSPLVMLGAVMFGLTIRLLLWVMGAADKEKTRALEAVLGLAKGILLFTLAMLVVTLLFPIVLIGAVIFALAMWIISKGLDFIGDKKAQAGVRSMLLVGLGILLLGIVIWAFNKMVDWMDILKVVVTIAGLALVFWVAGQFKQQIIGGSIAMIIAAIPIIMLSIAMAIWASAKIGWMDIAKIGVLVVGVAIAFAIAGIGPIPGFIMAGSVAMIVAAIPIMLLSISMMIWMKAKVTWEAVGILGALIAGLGLAMAGFGFLAPFIMAGSAAMIVAAIPLVLISGALLVFKKSGWTKKDGPLLEGALGSVINGFLGGPMPGGIFAAIKFAAKAAARAVLLFVTVPPMILAGLALLPITMGLLNFKKAKWTQKDSDNMEYAIGSVIKAFGLPGDYARQKRLGFYVSPWQLRMGIWALKNAGSTLVSLAQGIQAFANLTVPVYEYNEAKGELVIVDRVKMTENDFDLAAYGMAKVISAVSKPFAEVGRLEKGEGTGNPILDRIFAGNFVSTGVKALRGAGDIMCDLAKAVQAFANLTVSRYELKEVKDGDATVFKMVEVERIQMSEGDFENAQINMSKIVSSVADVFAKVGRAESEGGWFFSNNYVSKGVKALTGAGNIMVNLGKAVQTFANLTVSEWEYKETEDGGELVEVSRTQMTDGQFANARINMRRIVSTVADIFAEVGKAEDEGSWFFSNNYVSTGVKALTNAGQVISQIADGVQKMADLKFVEYGVKDGKIVPVGVTTMTSSGFAKAKQNMRDVIQSVMDTLWYAGDDFKKFQPGYDRVNEEMPKLMRTLGKVTSAFKKWNEAKITVDIIKTFKTWHEEVARIFDPKINEGLPLSNWYFTKFTHNITQLAKHAKTWDKIAKGMNQTAKGMTIYTRAVNNLDKDKLQMVDSLMASLAVMSNTSGGLSALGDNLGSSMEEGFRLLAEEIGKLIEEQQGGNSMIGEFVDGLTGGPADNTGGEGGNPAGKPKGDAPGKGLAGDIAKAVKSALSGLPNQIAGKTLTVRSSKQGGNSVSF